MIYTEPLLTADKILQLFVERKAVQADAAELQRLLNYERHSPESANIQPAINKLLTDGYLVPASAGGNYYYISGDGTLFAKDGMYEHFVLKQTRKEDISEIIEQLNLKTSNSVIDTGDSVQKLNSLLKPATIIQVITAILMFVVAGTTLWVAYLSYSYQKTNDEIGKRLKSLEEEQQKTEQRISKIPLSKVKDTVYTINIKVK